MTLFASNSQCSRIVWSVYNNTMECPRCKSHSVRMEKGARVCGVKNCTYIDVHPISYDNDVMHYEGEDKKENRFSTLYSSCLSAGGIELEKEANFDKNYKKGRKHIGDWCFQLKLNQHIIDIATARFLTILRIMNQEKEEGDEDDESQGGQQRKERHKNILSIKNMAAYSIYSACFQKEDFFEEFYLSLILGMSARTWKDLVKEMNVLLKNRIDFVPIVKPKHLVIRVCARRKIARSETRAMIETCDTIQRLAESDIRINTIAALAFWKVTEYSANYTGKFTLNDFCKSHEKMQQEDPKIKISEIQKYFDVTPDNVRKVFKESIKHKFSPRLLPDFQGRLPLKDCPKHEDDN